MAIGVELSQPVFLDLSWARANMPVQVHTRKMKHQRRTIKVGILLRIYSSRAIATYVEFYTCMQSTSTNMLYYYSLSIRQIERVALNSEAKWAQLTHCTRTRVGKTKRTFCERKVKSKTLASVLARQASSAVMLARAIEQKYWARGHEKYGQWTCIPGM